MNNYIIVFSLISWKIELPLTEMGRLYEYLVWEAIPRA